MRAPSGMMRENRSLNGRATLRQRLFAALLARGSATHDRYVAGRKRALLGDLHGDLLEIGAGAGPNLAYLPGDVRYVAVEPNPAMDRYLRDAAARAGLALEIRRGRAEALPAPDASADAVISTLVLCSVGDVAAALREIRRVLRPGGRLVFLEHVAAPPGSRTRRWQDAIRPLWQLAADGCQPNRDTAAALEQAGFAALEIERFTVPVPIVGPHIAGVALR